MNYDSNLEPLLFDREAFELVSISGQTIPADPIEVEVTEGFFNPGRTDKDLFTVIAIAALALGAIVIATRR